MTLGNIVSSTGSGLGCPDWPLCHGRVIPPGGTEIWIEFRHRLAVPLFSVLLVATAFVTWRRAAAPALRRLAVALVGLLVAQIVLGGVTVLLGLSPLVSTVHLLIALTVLAGLITICAVPDTPAVWRGAAVAGEGAAKGEPRLARFASAGLAVLLLQLALGGYVRHSGAGLACPDFPLCSGDMFPGHWLGWVHWLHRWLGVLLLGFFLHLARASRHGALAGVGAVLAGLVVAQVSLGILAVLLRLPIAVRATHAVVAYALWALLVWISVRAASWGGRVGSGSIIGPLGSSSAAPRQATAASKHSMGRE
jgi:heme A synthase